MNLHPRSLIIAATLAVVPLTGALAQGNNPTGNYGSNKSVTAGPGTADNKTASGMNTADSGATTPAVSGRAMNSNQPGATGRSVVPGSNSTIAGDASNSANQKTGGSMSGSSGSK